MYNFLLASGSRMRNIIGSDKYDEHWSDYMNYVSSSNWPILSDSQLVNAESFLQNWEANPVSGSNWFDEELAEHRGSFK